MCVKVNAIRTVVNTTKPIRSAITAAAGFASCIPWGTSMGLLLGLILKNVFKTSKNLFVKAVLK